MANGKKTDQARIRTAERRQRALELRKSGASYRQIADTLAVSLQVAHDDVQRALQTLAKLEQSSAEELRTMELARLDALAIEAARILRATHPLVSGGKVLDGLTDDGPKLAAIDRLLRISESRRKLLGLDAQQPIVVEQTYVLSEHERIERIIGLLDTARARAIGQSAIDVTPEPGDVAR